jgi:hypothetical protein
MEAKARLEVLRLRAMITPFERGYLEYLDLVKNVGLASFGRLSVRVNGGPRKPRSRHRLLSKSYLQ